MAKGKKIKRSNYSYRRKKHKARKNIIFIFVVILFVALGYFGAKFVFGRIAPENDKKATSSEVELTSEANTEDVADKPAPKDSISFINACVMSYEQVSDSESYQSFFEKAAKDGYTDVVIDLKDENGILYYKSGVELALSKDAVSDNAADLSTLIDMAKDAGLTPIARIVTLQDNIASYVTDATFLYDDTTSRWLDGVPGNGGKGWLNPYTQNARNYIADLCTELSGAGFETIILNKLQFPSNMSAHTNTLDTSGASKSEILKILVDEISEKTDAKIICQFNAESFFGENTAIYGAEPFNITSGAVLADIDTQTLSSYTLPDELKDIDFNNLTADSLGEFADYILKTNDEVMFYADKNLALALKELSDKGKIYGFVTK